VLLVCPKCFAASNEDLFCPHDGTRLIEPEDLPPSRRDGSAKLAPSPLAHTLPKNEPAGDPLVGQLVAGRYRVLGQLGEGGMGNVYRAVQETIEKKVALKVLKAEYSQSPDMVVRFHREAVSACRIKHPNVVDVFDLGQLEDGRFYIAMDLLEGRDLADVLAKAGALPPGRAVTIALQICRALNAAHQSGIVHRDLKPENVFLHRTSDGDEIVKIVDFGIAHLLAQEPDRAKSAPPVEPSPDGSRKLTSAGMIFGTPEYMAPEQASGGKIDHRADIYATGIILYKMLTGEAPFSGKSFLEVLEKQVKQEPPRMSKVKPDLDIPKELEQVVMRTLAKKPEDRYATMARFARALAYAARRVRRGRSSRVAIVAASLVIAAGVAAGLWLVRKRTTRAIAAEVPTAIPAPPVVVTTAVVAEKPVEPLAAAAFPSPEPVESSAPAPSAAPVVSAAPSASASAKPVRALGRPLPKPEPARAQAESPGTKSLPGIERCFETVNGERREVPCN
jgi:eukaryotic-like serine/threonine-protein kinase